MGYIRNILVSVLLASILIACTGKVRQAEVASVLILSGQNNHEWQKTSPLVAEILENSGLFEVSVTDDPDTLSYKSLKRYHVILSNRNTWPDTSSRMSRRWEKDFLKFISRGGGFVSLHAGSSSFYGWDDFHRIGIGRWGMDTRHGRITTGRICELDQGHPVTKGLKEFYITDEFWEKTDIFPGSIPIATVCAETGSEGKPITEPALLYNHFRKGRCIYIALGHDEKAIRNTGLRTLLIRSTRWAARKNIHDETIPFFLRENPTLKEADYAWSETDTSVCLKNNSDPIWQFNFNDRYGKPYFHPLTAGSSVLTCVSPVDHPWHLGLWFSWKFINGVNYWEYTDSKIPGTARYPSEGLTEITNIEITKRSDFSCGILMDLRYRPVNGVPVLSETRYFNVSPPGRDDSYEIDLVSVCTPSGDCVNLDRTPVEGEPDGKSWGGYAGLSVRFNQDFQSPFTIFEKENKDPRSSEWLYMGSMTLTGDTAGICILKNPEFTTENIRWYVISDPSVPLYYFSPAVLFDGKITLERNEKLILKYRIWIIPHKTNREILKKKYHEYIKAS